MAQQLTNSPDALTRGELKFAIVQTFNPDTEPTDDSINANGKPCGDGSRDMTGTVRLMDGTLLPFAYVDGRFPIREGDDLIRWDEKGYSPAWGGSSMSWPTETKVLLVEVQDGRVRRWTWPRAVLSDAYHISDHRYLEVPYDDCSAIRFLGLHCVIDLMLQPDLVEELVGKEHYDFPPAAVYVGHHADYYVV
ncbi:MAG TPA: hypothetical protein VFT87_05415 [Candidatus Saccharimonadales bacterium]|nr:hypothetical protein [Candidatus Saccharimonadales bacterium]